MSSDNSKKNHPEVDDIKNICEVTPGAKTTEDLCKKVNKSKKKPSHTKPVKK